MRAPPEKPMMRSLVHLQCAPIGLLVLFWAPGTGCAQQPQDSLRVHVTDGQKVLLVGAAAALISGGTIVAQAITGSDGDVILSARPGVYTLEVSAAGENLFVRSITLSFPGQVEEIVLRPAVAESVDVQAGSEDADPSMSSPTTVLPVKLVTELPSRPKTALEALPLVPGVVRTYDGQLQIAGQGESHSALLIDGVDENSPSTGRFTLSPPIDSVKDIHVMTPSFLAQDGRFTAGVVRIDTRSGGNKWHYDLNDPFPEFRIRSGHVRGLSSMSPRFAIGGPLMSGRLQLLESFGFIDNKVPVRTLPFPVNETKIQSSNSFTRLDASLSAHQSIFLSFQLSPQTVQFAGLDYFRPQSVTTNNDLNTYVGTASHRLVTANGYLQSTFSSSSYSESSRPRGTGPMVIRPTGSSGSFYKTTVQTSGRTEWNEALSFAPSTLPQHLVTLGSSIAITHGTGLVTEHPVLIEDAAGKLVQQIDFTERGPFALHDVQPAIYAQDHWTASRHLSMDFGARVEGQRITGATRVAPRLGIAWTSGSGTHATTIRAGVGSFYDNVPLNAYSFGYYPRQTITTFGQAGPLSTQYANVVGVSVHPDQEFVSRPSRPGNFSPFTPTESIEVEHAFGPRLTARARLLHSGSSTGLSLLPSPKTSTFVLSDGGQLNYTQMEFTAKVELQHGFPLYASYVYSSSNGSLNSPESVLSQGGGPFVRTVATGRQASDLPSRFILWGTAHLPWGLTLTPLFEIRSGFAYQPLDVYQNFVSTQGTSQGRLPTYGSLDLRASKLIKVNDKYSVRPALSVTNSTNHFNGLEVHSNVADPQFGTPFGNNDRHARFDLDVVF